MIVLFGGVPGPDNGSRHACANPLVQGFRHPPDAARPWVYWFWIDGNLSREGITADLEAMRESSIGGMVIMEVDVGIPRGPVRFMSEAWRALFRHAVTEADRLGLEITSNAGPGWTGSGGPWVMPDQSMQHLVASATQVTGPSSFDAALPRPTPREPHTVHLPTPPTLQQTIKDFYRDVAVLAFPTPADGPTIADCDEKALYYRNPYSSQPGVKPYLPALASYPAVPAPSIIAADSVIDISSHMQPDGRLRWNVPEGRWTILRFGRASTGANTRPAPAPGIGLESDKLDSAALDAHCEAFIGTLLGELPQREASGNAGWRMLHIDSWEMGAQNWTAGFRDQFRQRRGYDPLRFLPAMTGRLVGSLEVSERFLWDVRQTVQELIVENHAERLRAFAHRNGFGLSIEPYDMTPCSDLSLGGAADVPMCEFWAKGYGFNTVFSCVEAVSIAHTRGRSVVAAEAFTASEREAWRLHPGNMKAQADWAFGFGINRLVFHRYAHQPWLDRRSGMTMGPYGVHYERTQTWWKMTGAWHEYLARCQYLLRFGLPVADICYLAAEGAPHVFQPPPSALRGHPLTPDRREYNFDACAPETLLRDMSVRDGRLVLPDGMSYRVLVLPAVETMTPALLRKVKELVEAGATVIGNRPLKSPSLSGYPLCDAEVQRIAAALWGPPGAPGKERTVGKGTLIPSRYRVEFPSSIKAPVSLLARARWIWYPETHSTTNTPPGVRYFRRSYVVPDLREAVSARLFITADNSFHATINGRPAGEGNDLTRLYCFDVRPLLAGDANTIDIMAENAGSSPNPAGLLAVLEVRLGDGRVWSLVTDKHWEGTRTEGGPWQPAAELFSWGEKPWGSVEQDGVETPLPALYGDFSEVAGWLARAGTPPDFESDIPLRYTHRSDGSTDIYFIANPQPMAINTRVRFRVHGKTPELWDPASGRVFAHGDYDRIDGRTTLMLSLEPGGSVFTVFPATPSPGALPAEARQPLLRTVAEVTGPWDVHFAAGGGAPERLTFDSLVDWAQHPNTAVRHFSGEAIYARTLHINRELLSPGSRLLLDLGDVQVAARVRLNGRDLGTLWKAPFRVEITPAAKAGENALEIIVANLWPNRLIGDKAISEDQRVTWTTWNPYSPGDALLPSGLIGPVTLRIAATGS